MKLTVKFNSKDSNMSIYKILERTLSVIAKDLNWSGAFDELDPEEICCSEICEKIEDILCDSDEEDFGLDVRERRGGMLTIEAICGGWAHLDTKIVVEEDYGNESVSFSVSIYKREKDEKNKIVNQLKDAFGELNGSTTFSFRPG